MAKHRAHGRHRAPTPVRVVVVRIIGGTLAAGFALSLAIPTPDTAPAEAPPQATQRACMVGAPNGVDTVPTIPGTPAWDRCVGAAAMYGADAQDTGSLDVGAEVTINGRPWVATVTGLEPVSFN